MEARQRLIEIVAARVKELKLDQRYKDRVIQEIKEIDNQGEHEYFIGLMDSGKKFLKNENNLLVPYLLNLVDEFDIESPAAYTYGEFPDIDVDYLPMVRDYLKNEWAPKTFGAENVCSIGNYTTFGVKSALIDMVRVHGLDRAEVLRLTTKLPAKDDDGKDFTWEKAVASSKELAEYCKLHPEVATAAKKLVGRNRGKGKHAGGLVISSSRIDELVPLITDTDGTPISAWPEGLHTQDLQPVGLVKFDLLVITNLMQIAFCKKLIKERHGLQSICAIPGGRDWSDTSYLNDEKSLALANEGLLKCVFQFDSEGIRELAKKGHVASFDNLVAYSSLYRPGPMGEGMHERYVQRKKGAEEYAIHPVMDPVLGKTYAVMVYQEQIMKILNVVGHIPMRDCYKALKAISKKRGDIFEKYRQKFIESGVKVLGWDAEAVKELWDQVAAFSGYGFNLSHAVSYTYTTCRLLWLKAHYPLEFFAAILSCEDSAEKIREYRKEAERFGIKVRPVDINKSQVKFAICGDAIYVGLSNVKGVGSEVAQRIVDGQPYTSFEDFLNRFGTDASVMKPLIGLRAFQDADPVTLYEFYEYYKNETKKRQEREKRYLASRDNYAKEFRFLVLQCDHQTDMEAPLTEEHEFLTKLIEIEDKKLSGVFTDGETEQIPGLDIEQAIKVVKKYRTCIQKYKAKVESDEPISLKSFHPTGTLSEKSLQEVYEGDISRAEALWYGFVWVHLLQKSPDYKGGMTFEDFQRRLEVEGKQGAIEAWLIEPPKQMKTKKGDKTYYLLKIEDETGQQEVVTMWPDDYEIFKDALEYWESDYGKGNLIRIRLKTPDGYKRYSFDSPVRWERYKLPPKDKDHRLLVLERPKVEVPTKVDVTLKLKDLMLA